MARFTRVIKSTFTCIQFISVFKNTNYYIILDYMTSSSIIDMPWFCINRFVRISWINSCATTIKLLQWAYLIIIMQCRMKHRAKLHYTQIYQLNILQFIGALQWHYSFIVYIETLSTLSNWNNKNFQFPVLTRWLERILFKFTICTQYASIEKHDSYLIIED